MQIADSNPRELVERYVFGANTMNYRKTKHAKSIAFIHHRGEFDSVPSLMGSVKLLSQAGYATDLIFIADPAFAPPCFDEESVHLVALPSLRRLPLPESVRRILEALILFLGVFWRSGTRRYSWLVGIDPVGLIISGICATIFRLRYCYISLEILFSGEIKSGYLKTLKRLERYYNQRCAFTIIQDRVRADLLATENGVPHESILLLPNSPLGEVNPQHSRYLRERLDIPDDQKVVLHVGTLSKWTCTPQLLDVSRSWPATLKLVLHSRERGSEIGFDLADHPRLQISEGPVSSQDLPELIASADIGLVLYCIDEQHFMHRDNILYVGLSSGKMAEYLRCGVPVVVSAFPGMCDLMEEYHCGVCIAEMDEMADAIHTILADWANYSRGALRCFDEVFHFERHFAAVLSKLQHYS